MSTNHTPDASTEREPTKARLAQQVASYKNSRRIWETYAAALEDALSRACKRAIPEAIVKARAKTIASFAEKIVRKWDPARKPSEQRYQNPAEDFTDLCGARIIVHTLDQVDAVKTFVEKNFEVIQRDNKADALSDDRFGYRDMHFLIRLKADRATKLGFTPKAIATIGTRMAELQIRTLVQHAWADILHDRLYKAPLKLSREAKRIGALLAANMEQSDRTFARLARELDGMAANYTAYATHEHVDGEIHIESLVLESADRAADRVPAALRKTHLLVPKGQFSEIATLLEPLLATGSPRDAEVRLELGHALCRIHRDQPKSTPYARGIALIEEAIAHWDADDFSTVPDTIRANSHLARALTRLAWALEKDSTAAARKKAATHLRRALELEPGNPYYLAAMIGFELGKKESADDMRGSQWPAMLDAIQRCDEHAAQEIELPFAYFTSGRLKLLLRRYDEALHDYLRGAHHCLEGGNCYGPEVIGDEIAWLDQIVAGDAMELEITRLRRFLTLTLAARSNDAAPLREHASRASVRAPVIIIAGGADSLNGTPQLSWFRAPLTTALRDFTGTIISGGTLSGVPGLVGEITDALKTEGTKTYRLIGYRPKRIDERETPPDPSCDDTIRTGTGGFTADQIIANWTDILAVGIAPKDVRIIGIGGGNIAAIEYRMALAIGATVAVIPIPKAPGEKPDAVDALLVDPQWRHFKNLIPLPRDSATLRAFLAPPGNSIPPENLERMAALIHADYISGKQSKIKPTSLKPWEYLPDDLKNSNRAQAAQTIVILKAIGLSVRHVEKPPLFDSFTSEEIEHMAELEHGRWNAERLRSGWRLGKRDDEKLIHDNLVPWNDLTPEIKQYDRNAVKKFPTILAAAGFEVFRP